MRLTLLLPPRPSWPVSAAAAGRQYDWRFPPRPPFALTVYRLSPAVAGRDCYRLTAPGVVPAVISAGLYRSCDDRALGQLLLLLGVHAVFFCACRRLRIPLKTGRFVECGEEFVLEDDVNPYAFARLRVPRRLVVPGG